MHFDVRRFSAPKGHESLYGENPFLFSADYDLELDKKDIVVIQWEITQNDGSSELNLEEGLKTIFNNETFSLSTMIDLQNTNIDEKFKFKYRLFTLEAEQDSRVFASDFEIKAPSKGTSTLDLGEHTNIKLEAQPGGLVVCHFSLQGAGVGDWCGAAVAKDNNGNIASGCQLAQDGTVDFNIFIAGKPKTISGSVVALAANPWVEIEQTSNNNS